MAESWQKAEVPGPIKALLLNNPKVVAEYLKKANRSVIIIGDKILGIEKEGYKILDLIKKLSNKINAEIVTSSSKIIEEMREKNINFRIMPSIEFIDRLRDPNWNGFDGKGQYDLAIFIGFPYYYCWLILSNLKHFAYNHLKTLSLEPYYQPHATYSLQNNPLIESWFKFLNNIIIELK